MRGVRFIGAFFITAIMLVGCASSTEWAHPRKPKEMYTQDYAQCETTMRQDPKVQAASASGSKFMLQVSIERCLMKEGWLQVEKQP